MQKNGIRRLYRQAVLLCSLSFLLLVMVCSASALGPPRPGEIARLKAEGKYMRSLENALRIGNHLIDPALIQRFQHKMKRLKGNTLGTIEEFGVQLPPATKALLPASGTPKIFALLIEFNDEVASTNFPKSGQDKILWGAQDPATLPWDSLAAYYKRSSYGALDLSQGITLGWYKTSYNRSSVDETDTGRDNLIKEALNSFDATVDFSQFDNDGDGYVDYFIVIWAGPPGDWATFWWQYSTSFGDDTYMLDGKKLSRYTWQPVVGDPHVVIHETGHALGLPDLYDYDSDVGPRCGLGGIDPMDSYRGDHNCFSKWMLGWTDPIFVGGGPQELTLQATEIIKDQCVLTWNAASEPGIFSEFFLTENKQDVGNDSNLYHFPSGTPDGLAIWHIDSTLDGTGQFLYNNSTTSHKLVRLMEADGLEEIEAMVVPDGSICFAADPDDFYNTGKDFTPSTVPSSKKYDGSDSCVRVMNIVDEGPIAGDPITARFSSVCNTPPIAEAGGPYTAECQGPKTTIHLNGSGSYDPDPWDTLSYAWSSSCAGWSFNDSANISPQLTLNTSTCSTVCNVSLTVKDTANLTDTDSASVTVVDTTPPVITCPTNKTVECSNSKLPAATGVALRTDACTTTSLTYEDSVAPGACPTASIISRTWTAKDSCSNQSSCLQTINVVDTTPPVIHSVRATPNVLWPANHKMRQVAVAATTTDNCDAAPHCSITSIKSTEPVSGLGDGDTAPDWIITGDLTVDLRAERSGTENGRIYTLSLTCTDACGNSSVGTTIVTVPHDQKKK